MNIREMQYRFGIQMNQLNEALELHSDDIQYWLNKAQLELVKQKFNGFNQLRRGFEQSQQRIDDLKKLLVKDEVVSTEYAEDSNSPSGFYVDRAEIPEDNLFLISSRSAIKYKLPEIEFTVSSNKRETADSNDKTVHNKYVQSDDIYTLLEDPFNTTKPANPLIDISEDYINVYTDKSFIVDKVIINYLRLPTEMNIKDDVSCELDEHLHDEIIQRGVDLFLQNTRELKQRLQRETPTADKQQIEEDDE